MAFELVYTSAQEGLKTGSQGFCTVACTKGLPLPMATMLESLSGYRQLYSPGSNQENLNPVVYSHFFYQNGGIPLHLLSRISPAGLDYSNRSNKICHHLALKSDDLVPGGPAAVCSEPDLFIEKWDSPPTLFEHHRSIPKVQRSPGICHHWQDQLSDPGWGGILAASIEMNRPVCLLFSPGIKILPLFDEAIALLPKAIRWEATFTTFFTRLPAGIACQWKCVLAGSTEEGQVRAVPNIIIIDLNKRAPVPENMYSGPVFHKYLQMARDGIIPHPVTEQVPNANTTVTPPPVIITEETPPEFYSEHSESGIVLTGSVANNDADFLQNLDLSNNDGNGQNPPPINMAFSQDVPVPPPISSGEFLQINTELSSIPVPRGKKSGKKSKKPTPQKTIISLLITFLLMVGIGTTGYLVGRNNGIKIGEKNAAQNQLAKNTAPAPTAKASGDAATPPDGNPKPTDRAENASTENTPAVSATTTAVTPKPADASTAKASGDAATPSAVTTKPTDRPDNASTENTPAVSATTTDGTSKPAKKAVQNSNESAQGGNVVILGIVTPVLEELGKIRLSPQKKGVPQSGKYTLDTPETKEKCKKFCDLFHKKGYQLELTFDPLIKQEGVKFFKDRFITESSNAENEMTVIVKDKTYQKELFKFVIGKGGLTASCTANDDNRCVANLFLFSFLKWTVLNPEKILVHKTEKKPFYQTFTEGEIICDYNLTKSNESKINDTTRGRHTKNFFVKYFGDAPDKFKEDWPISISIQDVDSWDEKKVPLKLECQAAFIRDANEEIKVVNIKQDSTKSPKNTTTFYCELKYDNDKTARIPLLDVSVLKGSYTDQQIIGYKIHPALTAFEKEYNKILPKSKSPKTGNAQDNLTKIENDLKDKKLKVSYAIYLVDPDAPDDPSRKICICKTQGFKESPSASKEE